MKHWILGVHTAPSGGIGQQRSFEKRLDGARVDSRHSCGLFLCKDQVCGLCGNFDGIQNNDLTSSTNQLEVDPNDFGNSWKVNSQCADIRKVLLYSWRGRKGDLPFLNIQIDT